MALKASTEFATIRGRVASEECLDSWKEENLHFFVFSLLANEEVASDEGGEEGPVAVFAMHPASNTPFSAVVVSPRPGGLEAEIRDLGSSQTAYVAPVSFT